MRARILLFTTIAGTVAVSIIVAFVIVVGRTHDAGRQSNRAEAVVDRAQTVELLVSNLRAGSRGYVATGKLAQLQPYSDATRRLPAALDALESAAAYDARSGVLARQVTERIQRYQATWSDPLVRLAAEDLEAARRRLRGSGNLRQGDIVRALIHDLAEREERAAAAARTRADDAASAGLWVAIIAAIVAVLVAAVFGRYLIAAVVDPVRRIAGAVDRIGVGDFDTEVWEEGAGEVGQLARGLNQMRRSLVTYRDELEGHHAEVEAQRNDLERTFAELAREKAWVEALLAFVEGLVGESDVQGVSDFVLRRLAQVLGADAGVLYVVDGRRTEDGVGAPLVRRALLGLDPASIPRETPADHGPAGRALLERRPVTVAHGETGLEIRSLGGRARVSHELHLPLRLRDRVFGVVSVGRAADRPFTRDQIEHAHHLGEQAVVGLASAVEGAESTRLAAINETVLNATSFGLALFSPEDLLTVANPRMREIYSLLDVDLDAPPQERFAQIARVAVDRSAADHNSAVVLDDPSRAVELDLHHAESGRWFRAATQPVRDTHGGYLGRLVTIEETTAYREVQRLKDEFVATVTHELRTPLSSIVAAVELLADETGEQQPDQLHWTAMIRRNVDRLLRLVDDLLTVARAEAGQFEVARGAADLAEIAQDAVGSARASAEAKGVALELDADATPLYADAARLAQVCDNLLANAVKFTPAGGRIAVTVRTLGGTTAMLRVADSGIGIPLEDREQLFERFYRAPAATAGAVPGTGLGLTITKAIVDAHGGTVRVEDGIDGGTAFVVELPVAPPVE
nr:ATP-binding protein [Patulibacter sp. SYSU D01012]